MIFSSIRNSYAAAALGLAIGLLSPRVDAAPISFSFSGTVTSTLFKDQSLQGTLTYDSASYTEDILEGSVSVGAETWSYVPRDVLAYSLTRTAVHVFNNVFGQFDEVGFAAGLTGPSVFVDGVRHSPSFLFLAFGTEGGIDSNTIPTDPTILNTFTNRYAHLFFYPVDSQGAQSGRVVSLVQTLTLTVSTVPEPSPAALLIAAVCMPPIFRRLALKVLETI